MRKGALEQHVLDRRVGDHDQRRRAAPPEALRTGIVWVTRGRSLQKRPDLAKTMLHQSAEGVQMSDLGECIQSALRHAGPDLPAALMPSGQASGECHAVPPVRPGASVTLGPSSARIVAATSSAPVPSPPLAPGSARFIACIRVETVLRRGGCCVRAQRESGCGSATPLCVRNRQRS